MCNKVYNNFYLFFIIPTLDLLFLSYKSQLICNKIFLNSSFFAHPFIFLQSKYFPNKVASVILELTTMNYFPEEVLEHVFDFVTLLWDCNKFANANSSIPKSILIKSVINAKILFLAFITTKVYSIRDVIC